MTKSLTEKWKDGELEEGFYYILFASRFGKDYIAIDMFIQDEKDFMYSSCEDVKEVLAPVPSYDEYKELLDLNVYEKLQKQLKEANHILKDVFISNAYYKSKQAQYLKKWGVK